MSDEKACSMCDRLLPLSAFNRAGNGRTRRECSECSRFIRLSRTPKLPATRQCKTCGKTKSIYQFPVTTRPYSLSGHARQRNAASAAAANGGRN
jgi:hypothetical protein